MGSLPDPQDGPPPALPFWHVNVAPADREPACPPYLQKLSAKDVAIIGTRDADYRAQSWADVVATVRAGRLHAFRRRPSDLRRYREFVWRVAHEWGSVMEYMLRERLQWTAEEAAPEPGRPRPFAACGEEEDVRVLFNDWPYGVDGRIVHLVVWTRFALPDDAKTEAEIERFVERTFLRCR